MLQFTGAYLSQWPQDKVGLSVLESISAVEESDRFFFLSWSIMKLKNKTKHGIEQSPLYFIWLFLLFFEHGNKNKLLVALFINFFFKSEIVQR